MEEFPNPNEEMVSDSLTPISQAPTVMQPQLQQAIPPQQVQTTEVDPRHKHKNTLHRFGISEVVLGSISVILGMATLIIAAVNPRVGYYSHGFTWISQGIWCGLFLIATGILGIKAKSNPSVRMYNANMAMSIITANIMVPLMVLSGFAAGILLNYYDNPLYSLVALHFILGIVGFAAGIVCIVHSAYCCAGVCCRRTPDGGHVTPTPQPYGVQQPHQMVRLANGQYILVPVYPGVSEGYTVMPNPMIAGQAVYQPPQGGPVMLQNTMSGQPVHEQATAAYIPHGSQQPVQVNTAINAPPQVLESVPYPTATAQVATDVNGSQAPTAEAPAGYSPCENE